jgi:hypothetical protein
MYFLYKDQVHGASGTTMIVKKNNKKSKNKKSNNKKSKSLGLSQPV